jgi:hypothetical protein
MMLLIIANVNAKEVFFHSFSPIFLFLLPIFPIDGYGGMQTSSTMTRTLYLSVCNQQAEGFSWGA